MPYTPDQLATQGIGMGYEQFTMQQQQQNQIELMGLQQGYNLELMNEQLNNQMGLNQQGHDLQFDMWNKTNAEAQMKHLKKAGLNPALMYKQGGAGGNTGSQSGGSASGGNAGLGMAPQSPQMKLFGAQLRKLNAEAKLTEERATNEAGGVRLNLEKEAEEIASRTNINVVEAAKRMSQKEMQDIENDIRRYDKNYIEEKGLPETMGVIWRALKEGGMAAADIVDVFISHTETELLRMFLPKAAKEHDENTIKLNENKN